MRLLALNCVWLILLGGSCWCSIYHDEDEHITHSLPTKPKSKSASARTDVARQAPPDDCAGDDIESVSADMTPGVCRDFDLSSCLCNLNANCYFEANSNTCAERQDCLSYNQNPKQCRVNHCIYDCNTGECSHDGTQSGCGGETNAPGATAGKCNSKCHDICSCKGAGCNYDIDRGLCSEIKEFACPDSAFLPNECARKDGVYYRNGHYCRSPRQRGYCTREAVILAVNLGGENITDRNGIQYVENHRFPGVDTKKVVLKGLYPGEISGVLSSEQKLYTTSLYANERKRDSGGCLSYEFRVCEEGRFELTIKTVEVAEVFAGEKFFNVKFCGKTVFPEVDLVKIAGSRLRPVDLIVSFEYKNNQVNIPGQSSIITRKGALRLEFCFGDCIFAQGYFQASAISVVKLDDWRKQYQISSSCSQYDGKEGDCATANCEYDGITDECVPFYKSDICDDKMCGFYEQATSLLRQNQRFECELYSCEVRLQLALVLDSTGYYSAIKSTLPDIMTAIRDKVKSMYANAEYAFTTTSNWNLEAFTQNPGETQGHHLPEGCYTRRVRFTPDINKLIAEVNNVKTELGWPAKAVEADSALAGAAFAGVDTDLGWIRQEKDKAGRRVYRFVLVFTDDDTLFELPFPGNRTQFRLDGSDTCSTTNPPTYYSYKRVFTSNRINLIGLYEKNALDLEGIYGEHFKKIKTSYCAKSYAKGGPPEEIAQTVANCLKEKLTCFCNKPNKCPI